VPNPEQGGGEQGIVGTWQTVNLAIPDFLAQIREAVNAFFSAIIQLLNILLAILEVLKTLAFGFLDPIIALIEALLAQIEAFLRDLRNAGLYIHGDFYILEGPEFKDLLGGYNAYETRMITRFVDRRDPNRPDISSRSACLAVFLYVSVDLTAFHRLLRLLRGILGLFNRNVPLPPSVGQVTNLNASFGLEGASIFSFKKSFFPDARLKTNEGLNQGNINTVNLTWNMAPTPGNFVTLFPQLPPRGFLVEISTIFEPLKLTYEKPPKGADQAVESDPSLSPPKREAGPITDRDGNQILLTGGADWLDFNPALKFNSIAGFGPSLTPKVYGIKALTDAVPVPLEDLKQGNKHYLQKTFFVPTAQSLFFPGKGYGVTLKFDEMPFAAEWEFKSGLLGGSVTAKRIADDEQPQRYYVRVRAVSKAISDVGDFRWLLDNQDFERGSPVMARLPGQGNNAITPEDVGPASSPFELVWPSVNTEDYLRCVAEALCLMVLARADLSVKVGSDAVPEDGSSAGEMILDYPPRAGQLEDGHQIYTGWPAFEGSARLRTQLEDAAQIHMVRVIGRNRRVSKYYSGDQSERLTKWRQGLYHRCVNWTSQLFRQNRPTATLEKLVVDRCQGLLNFDLGAFGYEEEGDNPDRPLNLDADMVGGGLLALLLDTREYAGIAPNRLSTGAPNIRAQVQTRDLGFLQRGPHFFSTAHEGTLTFDGKVFSQGKGSRDSDVPVVYQRNSRVLIKADFLRNLVNDDIYEQAAFALRIATGPLARPQEKGWIAIRLFPQGIPDIDRFLEELLALLKSIAAALQSIADLIRRFIEFLQARIIELQALLNRINATIQNLLTLFGGLPAVAGLVTVANGTDGVLASFVSAQNKPFDSPAAYGGGVVLFAGGIPSIALDIFKALVQGDD